MLKLFRKKKEGTDWSKHFGDEPVSRKQRLIDECNKQDVTIYKDESSENTDSIMRPVASEAELERRLNSKNTMSQAKRANIISAIALFVALISIVISIYEKKP
jgi:hypothetical protein